MAYSDLDSMTLRLGVQDAAGAMSPRMFVSQAPNSTLANTTSGSIHVQRFTSAFVVPSVSGYTGWELSADMLCEDQGCIVAALEYSLGSLNVATNVFTAGSDASTPTKTTRISGASYAGEQTASMIPVLVATAALTATNPVITITYVNEDGVGSRTASLTIPTGTLLQSGFNITPHLQSGDTGLSGVTNMTRSTGTAGTLSVRGLIPVSFSHMATNTTNGGGTMGRILKPCAPVVALPGEVLAFYNFGQSNPKDVHAIIRGRPV